MHFDVDARSRRIGYCRRHPVALGPARNCSGGRGEPDTCRRSAGRRILLGAFVFRAVQRGGSPDHSGPDRAQLRFAFQPQPLRHVLGLLAAAIVGTAVSGVGGTLGFKYLHGSTAPALTTWQHWFASDALGILAVAPLLIGLASAAREPPPRSELIEGLVALAALAVMSGLVIFLPREPWATAVPIALLFPMLLWLAARCRPVFAAAAAFIVALTIVWTTTFGIGIFGDPSLPIADRILGAQAGILACRCAHSFSPRCLPSGASKRPCSWRARRGCRRR